MIKKKMLVVSLGVMMLCLMSGCGATKEENTREQATTEAVTTTEQATTEENTEDAYAGMYLDYDNNEPNLTIKAKGDGTYEVTIGIFRLAVFDDGVGTLSENGLEFTATDSAGNPIKGVITLEGNEAVVTFTDSTWEMIENGTSFRYYKPE